MGVCYCQHMEGVEWLQLNGLLRVCARAGRWRIDRCLCVPGCGGVL